MRVLGWQLRLLLAGSVLSLGLVGPKSYLAHAHNDNTKSPSPTPTITPTPTSSVTPSVSVLPSPSGAPSTGLVPGWKYDSFQFASLTGGLAYTIPNVRSKGIIASTKVSGSVSAISVSITRNQLNFGAADKDNVYFRFYGYVRIRYAANYIFKLGSDDGSLLYINGVLVRGPTEE